MVYCSPEHRFGSDALLLARFCEPKRAQKAADLCSGCGIVALEWHDRGHRGPCMGLELQPEGSALLSAAVQEQDIGHIEPVCADLRAFRQGEAVLRAHRLEPKRLAFVKNKADGAPWLFLVEAQKNRKTGLRVEPDVLISAGAALYGR